MSEPVDEGVRVLTPDGPGIVAGSRAERVWLLGEKPRRIVWVTVELDRGGRRDYDFARVDLERAE